MKRSEGSRVSVHSGGTPRGARTFLLFLVLDGSAAWGVSQEQLSFRPSRPDESLWVAEGGSAVVAVHHRCWPKTTTALDIFLANAGLAQLARRLHITRSAEKGYSSYGLENDRFSCHDFCVYVASSSLRAGQRPGGIATDRRLAQVWRSLHSAEHTATPSAAGPDGTCSHERATPWPGAGGPRRAPHSGDPPGRSMDQVASGSALVERPQHGR